MVQLWPCSRSFSRRNPTVCSDAVAWSRLCVRYAGALASQCRCCRFRSALIMVGMSTITERSLTAVETNFNCVWGCNFRGIARELPMNFNCLELKVS